MKNDTFVLKGQAVKVARYLKGMKLNDFAKKVGIDPDYLSKIENGERGISERNQGLLLRGLIYKLKLSYEEIAAIHILVEYVKGGIKNG
ncbi:helix-turn-helix domain-containing protein [Terribacillus sp. DMT04]|uniref:helix-turn-helix domain-containing protein n=1 Tax=Terribacillus sp. DMT04 TaxID=2850441 RepID=UPI001C2B8E7A|nr:helix-turn-helix transcriptional regulator [Terribacillus sp. DMT04]QXE01733.1 helix-turn-helix transcriptional regulator [Terribacillus sp. DMT04]